MKILTTGKKPILCDGPCPYEPLVYPGGTLSDGTTYTFTATAGATVNDLGSGSIEHGTANETLTVTFSAPVDFKFTNAVAPTTRTVWHGINVNTGTQADTDGSTWCLTPGTQPTQIDIDGQRATSIGQPGVDANWDWGNLETFSATQIDMRAYVWDVFNYEARPRTLTCEQEICDVTDDLRRRLKAQESGSGSGNTSAVSGTITGNTIALHDDGDGQVTPINETVTSLSIAGDTLTYTDESGTANNLALTHPAQEICTGIFKNCNNRSSWWQGWSPIITANQGTQTLIDWRTLGTGAVTSPNCVADMTFQADVGNHYLRNRRNRTYMWIDYRLLINGVAVYTRSNQIYRYSDERDEQSDTGGAPGVPVNIEAWGGFVDHRDNVPAGSSVEVQVRVRWNINASQSDSYTRYIGGLYSRATFQFSPNQIVTGRL